MKKYKKQGMGLMTTGIGLGLGSQIASESGSPQGALAMGKLATGVKVAGGVMGAGMVLDSVKGLQKSAEMPKKKKGKYY